MRKDQQPPTGAKPPVEDGSRSDRYRAYQAEYRAKRQKKKEKVESDGILNNYPGSDLDADAIEFGRALGEYKERKNRRFPSCSEILEVLKSLGYRKEKS